MTSIFELVIDGALIIILYYFSETLRKYPVLLTLFREATQNYQVPDDKLVIEKGTKILIPTYSLHYDYRYYPDPETFDPERFTPEEKAKRPSGIYMPFGDGPRICLGNANDFYEILIKYKILNIIYNTYSLTDTDTRIRPF